MMMSRRAASRWLYRRAKYDPKAAMYLAQLAANYLEEREPMPIEMEAWLANSLWAIVEVREKANGEHIDATRTTAWGRALGLMKRQGSPRFVDRLFIRMGLPAIKSGKQSETAFAKKVGQRFGVSLNIARNHIRREMAFAPGVEARECIDDVLTANGVEVENGLTGEQFRMLVKPRDKDFV